MHVQGFDYFKFLKDRRLKLWNYAYLIERERLRRSAEENNAGMHDRGQPGKETFGDRS